MNASATRPDRAEELELRFGDFLAAGTAGAAAGDPLAELTSEIAQAQQHISAIEAEVDRYARDAKRGYPFFGSCSPCGMRSELWETVIARVNTAVIAPAKVNIGSVEDFVLAALGFAPGGDVDTEEKLRSWDAAAIRRHFRQVVGDPRERRIAELREKVLFRCRHNRPEEKYDYRCGEHHQEPVGSFGGCRTLRLTYSSSNLDELGTLIRFAIHLATGQDPLEITLPPIYGWTDGEKEWPRAKLFLRIRNPFPGAAWMRWSAGFSVEFGFTPEVLARFQAHWDAYPRGR